MKVVQKCKTGVYFFRCPGCGIDHAIHTLKKNHCNAQWSFNGNVDIPTFQPSINSTLDFGKGEVERCHFFIKEGLIEFCGDSTHDHAGKTLPLPDLDERYINIYGT